LRLIPLGLKSVSSLRASSSVTLISIRVSPMTRLVLN
jgi:hypothetical protein